MIERWYEDEKGERWVFDGVSSYDGRPLYRKESGEEHYARTADASWRDWYASSVADPYLDYIKESGRCPNCGGPATVENNGGSPDSCDLGHCVRDDARKGA